MKSRTLLFSMLVVLLGLTAFKGLARPSSNMGAAVTNDESVATKITLANGDRFGALAPKISCSRAYIHIRGVRNCP